jgi:hypothetical protein
MARIKEAAFFGVEFEISAIAQGAANCPLASKADREQERDQVQGGAPPPCWSILTSSAMASASAIIEQKSLGYEP